MFGRACSAYEGWGGREVLFFWRSAIVQDVGGSGVRMWAVTALANGGGPGRHHRAGRAGERGGGAQQCLETADMSPTSACSGAGVEDCSSDKGVAEGVQRGVDAGGLPDDQRVAGVRRGARRQEGLRCGAIGLSAMAAAVYIQGYGRGRAT